MIPFPPISLEEMDAVRLMNRIDSKYLTTEDVLDKVLRSACEKGYRAFELDGRQVNAYDSMYYDTSLCDMYRIHRTGRLVRQKVRVRTYLTNGVTYLEVKRKNNHGRTRKKRIRVPQDDFSLMCSDPVAVEFLGEHCKYPVSALSPSLVTSFDRITLVNPEMTERLTIDTALRFRNPRTGLEASLGRAVIIELKQDGHARSTMKEIFLEHRVKPKKLSKYCIGLALTDPSLVKGRFKEKIRYIEKLTDNKLI